jgi:ketosteroid isomerase-like protein
VTAAGSSPDTGAVESVLAAARNLVRVFGEHDTAGYFGCFAPDATFIFYTTAGRLTSREQYQRLWRQWEEQDGFRVISCRSDRPAVQLLGDAAVFAHDVTTVVSLSGTEQTLHERETIVFRREAGGWIAVHEHLSPQPG